MWMMCIFSCLMFICLGNSFAETTYQSDIRETSFPPRWADGQSVDIQRLRGEITQKVDMTEAGGELELTCKDGEIKVNTCGEYFDLLRKECYAGSSVQMVMQSGFTSYCDVRKDLIWAKPSKVSYVQNLAKQTPKKFFESFDLGYFIRRESSDSKTLDWTSLAKDAVFERVGEGVFSFKSEFEGLSLRVELLAFGDINNDQIEDVNIYLVYREIGGSLVESYNLWYTALDEDALLERIDQLIDLREEQCIARDESTAGMANCTKRAEAAWDQEMNRAYGLLMKALDKKQADNLRQAQRAWLEYRDKEFKNIGALFSDKEGTMWVPVRAAHYRDIVKQRALALMGYFNLLED